MNKTALITGVTCQDGAYLSKFLLGKGYKVIGLVRNYTIPNFINLEYLGTLKDITIASVDLRDISQIIKIIKDYQPIEIYNLAAQSSVGLSFSQPISTIQFNINSVLNLVEAIKIVNPKIKFYQASSSEMFGRIQQLPINDTHTFHPLSPYGVSKASAHWVAVNYRESYELFIACGVLFNHESYLRKDNFFVKKVLKESINIKFFNQNILEVGNIDIKRDFGFAPKYVEAMWLMLQSKIPKDYLICSGQSITLRSIIEYIFNRLDIPHSKIVISEKFYRPTDIEDIYGDNSSAKEELKWKYDLNFYDVLDLMLAEELLNTKSLSHEQRNYLLSKKAPA